MPDFAKAEYADSTKDLTSYASFARKLRVGQIVSVPLEDNESSRQVMRWMNQVAAKMELRLARLESEDGRVRFKVLPIEKRKINMSEEAKRARVAKARATRLAHKRASTRKQHQLQAA